MKNGFFIHNRFLFVVVRIVRLVDHIPLPPFLFRIRIYPLVIHLG